MASQSQIASLESRIYSQAKAGTPVNPKGLPDALASLLVAQANHETGRFSSNIFIQGNNAFGYTHVPGGRYQLPEPGRIADNGQPAAKYANVEDSVREIVDWIYRRVKEGKFPANLDSIQTPAQYAQLLKNAGYYGDTLSNYQRGLQQFFKVVKENPVPSGLLILVLLYLGYRLLK